MVTTTQDAALVTVRRREFEQAVLGAALRGFGDVMSLAADHGLAADCFFVDEHRDIWQALVDEDRAGRSPDVVAVAERLRRLGKESDYLSAVYLIELTEKAPVAQNMTHYVRELVNLAWGHRAAEKLDSLARSFRTAAPFDGWERARAVVADALVELADEKQHGGGARTPVERIDRLAQNLEERVESFRSGKLRGVPTGFRVLDRIFAGWVPGRIYFLCARPGVGKTAVALNFVEAAERADVASLVFTLEMSDTELDERRLAMRSGVNAGRIQSGDFDEASLEKILDALKSLSQSKCTIDERSGRYIETFESAVRRGARRDGVRLVILDYLQQMNVRGRRFENRATELKEITSRVKKLAQDEKVAIIVVAQLGRDADKGTKALLSHIKEGGSAEQDADVVMFVEREDNPDANVPIYIRVAKNRHGRRFKLLCKADLSVNRVEQASINDEAFTS